MAAFKCNYDVKCGKLYNRTQFLHWYKSALALQTGYESSYPPTRACVTNGQRETACFISLVYPFKVPFYLFTFFTRREKLYHTFKNYSWVSVKVPQLRRIKLWGLQCVCVCVWGEWVLDERKYRGRTVARQLRKVKINFFWWIPQYFLILEYRRSESTVIFMCQWLRTMIFKQSKCIHSETGGSFPKNVK